MLAILFASPRALANGAFPDSLSIFVPADRPAELVLATNFGLVTTTDDGATWDWVCEHSAGALAGRYQRAAPPSQRLFGVAPAGLVYSDDGACSWSVAADLAATAVTDAFADPVDPSRLLALAAFIDASGQARNGLFISTDAGATFGAPAYVSPPNWTLASVEASASSPSRLYMTSYEAAGGPIRSHLLRSDDGGRTWSDGDITAVTGDRIVRIAAVDPLDAQKIYLRLTGADDAIAVSTDGGATLSLPLVVGTQLTALLRREGGQVLVSALDVVDGALYRSTDAGASFVKTSTTLRIRALAERSGKIYAATDNVLDGFALGVSTDDGLTFQPLLKFDEVRGARMCGGLVSACAATCETLVGLNVFAPSACQTAPGGAHGTDGGRSPPAREGCACNVASRSGPDAVLGAATLLAALRLRRRRSSL